MADRPNSEPAVRRRRPRTPKGIPYATVEALAATMHGIGEDGLAALRARIHSLRRLDFPNGVSGSSGRHFDYGLADVIGVLAALELAEAYVPPAASCAIVREGWPEIVECALAGIGDERERGVATIHPNGLYQALAHAETRTSDTLHVEVAVLAPPPAGRRTVEIAVGSVARRALEELKRIDPPSAQLARAQLVGLEARFGHGEPLPRPSSNDGRLASDGPFWARAHSIVHALAGNVLSDTDRRRATWQLGYLARPAPVETWKTRVEVDPDLHDVGFAAAVVALAHLSDLRNGRIRLSPGDAERIWRRMTAVIGDRKAILVRLGQIAAAGQATGARNA